MLSVSLLCSVVLCSLTFAQEDQTAEWLGDPIDPSEIQPLKILPPPLPYTKERHLEIIRRENDGIPVDVLRESFEAKKDSIGYALAWNPSVAPIDLKPREREAVQKLLTVRRTAQEENHAKYRQELIRLKQNEEYNEKSAKKCLNKFTNDENDSEDALLNGVDEVLNPEQHAALVNWFVKSRRYSLGNYSLLHKDFELSLVQRKHFRAARAAALASAFGGSKRTEAEKKADGAEANRATTRAHDSLTREQFERWYSTCCDMGGDDMAAFYEKQSESEQMRLSKYYKWFRIVRNELAED